MQTTNNRIDPPISLRVDRHFVTIRKAIHEVLDVVALRAVRRTAYGVQALRRMCTKEARVMEQGMIPIGLVLNVHGTTREPGNTFVAPQEKLAARHKSNTNASIRRPLVGGASIGLWSRCLRGELDRGGWLEHWHYVGRRRW